jgi:hypothetical protein
MERQIRIRSGSVTATAMLNESETSDAVWDALPITGRASTWGDEVYFRIPVTAREDAEARAEVEVGELGYWPPGSAFCIFFGPTPASVDDQPQAASPVNVLGRIEGDAAAFRSVRDGQEVVLERATAE